MKKKGFLITGAISLSLVLAGCFEGEQSLEEMDPPQDAEAVDQLDDISSDEEINNEKEVNTEETGDINEESTEMVPRELYLIDKNGMVASQTLELPKLETNEVATQVLEHLVKGGPVSSMLPNGFQAVLPEGTEILGLNLKEDGTMVVDVSEEFKNYEPQEEVKILEALTYTLTQFENVNQVQLLINGHEQDVMPVDGTPIGNGYSRDNGINIVEANSTDLLNSIPVTMYYPSEHNENRYYVPITQYIESKENEELYTTIVKSLLEGPGYNNNVIHVFNSNTLLEENPVLNDGVLQLTFNEAILMDEEKYIIADEVIETLVRTLTEQEGIEAVDVKVENVEQLVSENGESYDEPVTKQSILPKEKL